MNTTLFIILRSLCAFQIGFCLMALIAYGFYWICVGSIILCIIGFVLSFTVPKINGVHLEYVE